MLWLWILLHDGVSALIVAQRAYEMNSKVISTADQMLSVASQVKS